MSTPDESDRARRGSSGATSSSATPPKPVEASFWLWITSGAVFIIGYLIVLLARNTVIDQLVRNNTRPDVTPEQIAQGTTMLLTVLLVGAVCFAVLYGLFAYKARQGTRSARTVLTVLTAITLVFQLALQFASLITLFATLIALIALGLLYLPSVNAYFPKPPRLRP